MKFYNIRPSYFIVSMLLFIFIGRVNAQLDSCNNVIKGAIYDQVTKEPLPFATVQLKEQSGGAYTNEDGSFEIEAGCEKEYDLQISFIGYKTVTHHHDFYHPFVEIFLAPEGTVLKGIVVEAESDRDNLQTGTSSKISEEALQRLKSESLGEVVSQLPGVTTIKTGQNVAKPVIHGLHSNRILVINNGVRHEFQNWGIDHAPEIDPAAVDEIQVVKGAATVRFGPEALGGVILTNNNNMELSTPLEGHVDFTGKSNGQSGEASAELRKGFKWLSLLAGGSATKQGDLQAPNYLLTNTGKEESSYYGGFRIHPFAELDIEGYYSHFDQNLGILLGSTFGNLEDLGRAIDADEPFFTRDTFSYNIGQPRQEAVHDLYKAKARYLTNKQSLEVQYGYQKNRRREFGQRRGEAPTIHLELVTESVDADWKHPDIGALSGKIGVQWQKQANDNIAGTNTVPFIPNYDSREYGIYWIESLELDRSTFEFGVRYDNMEADITGREPDNTIYRNSISYRNFTGTLGYKHQIDEHSSFRTNFGTAWRPPNVAELYRFGQHAFFLEYGLWRYTIDERFDFVSTSGGIQTEEDRAVPSEVGYKWINTYNISKENFQLEATAYVNYIENYIYAKPGGLTRTPRGFFVYFIYDQTDALFWGADLSVQMKHSPQLTSNLVGSYIWAKQIRRDDFFAGLPPPNLGYSLEYEPNLKFLDQCSFTLSTDYTFEQMQHPRILGVEEFLNANRLDIKRFSEGAKDFDLIPPPGGYFLAHFSWNAAWKQLHWQFKVQNIFNVSYRNYTDRMRYFADDLGRNVIGTLAWRF
ncbi:MAG: TonB-dependent receptor [Bacteroidota bacterium]